MGGRGSWQCLYGVALAWNQCGQQWGEGRVSTGEGWTGVRPLSDWASSWEGLASGRVICKAVYTAAGGDHMEAVITGAQNPQGFTGVSGVGQTQSGGCQSRDHQQVSMGTGTKDSEI